MNVAARRRRRCAAGLGLLVFLATSVGCASRESARPTMAPVIVDDARASGSPSVALPTASTPTVPPADGLVAAASPTATPGQAALIVTNTGKEGAILRREPGGDYVRVLPDRMRLADLGEQRSEAGRAWRRVRTPEGQEGWVAAELVAAAGSAATAARPTSAVSAVQTALAVTRTTVPTPPMRDSAEPAGPPLDLIPTATLRPPSASEPRPRATSATAAGSPRPLPAPRATGTPASRPILVP